MPKRFLHACGLVALTFLASIRLVSGQPPVALFVQGGYASFSAGDLKEFNDGLLRSLQPVPAKLISNYPSYLIYSAKLSLFPGDRDMMISLYGSHTSTGSRISYVDYSGFIYFDQRAVTNSIGSEIAVPFYQENDWEIFGGLRYTTNFNRIEFNSEVQSPSNYDHLALSFANVTHGLQPTVYVMRSIRSLILSFELGYNYEFAQKLSLAGNKGTYLVDDDDNPIKYSGSGIRAQLGIGLKLSAE